MERATCETRRGVLPSLTFAEGVAQLDEAADLGSASYGFEFHRLIRPGVG